MLLPQSEHSDLEQCKSLWVLRLSVYREPARWARLSKLTTTHARELELIQCITEMPFQLSRANALFALGVDLSFARIGHGAAHAIQLAACCANLAAAQWLVKRGASL